MALLREKFPSEIIFTKGGFYADKVLIRDTKTCRTLPQMDGSLQKSAKGSIK